MELLNISSVFLELSLWSARNSRRWRRWRQKEKKEEREKEPERELEWPQARNGNGQFFFVCSIVRVLFNCYKN